MAYGVHPNCVQQCRIFENGLTAPESQLNVS